MRAVDFCYWMQGMFELTDTKSLNEQQTELVKRHLNMVFIHDIDKMAPDSQQAALNEAHNGNNGWNPPPKMWC